MLDCRGEKTGEEVSRDEAHTSGAWHGAFHCLVVYERQGRGYALFQKRSLDKKIAPGKFDVTVGGHYASGENSEIAGPREIREEIGLDVDFRDLLPAGRRVFVYCFTPGVKDHEIQDVFLLHRAVQSKDLTLQQEEVEAMLEMDIEAGISLFGHENTRAECLLWRPGEAVSRLAVSVQDFVPCPDNYYLKLLLVAQRYFKGERKHLVV